MSSWRIEGQPDELLGFPVGVRDDQVDALGLIDQLLDRVCPGIAPKALPKPTGGLSGYFGSTGNA